MSRSGEDLATMFKRHGRENRVVIVVLGWALLVWLATGVAMTIWGGGRWMPPVLILGGLAPLLLTVFFFIARDIFRGD